MATDPRFSTNDARLAHRDEFRARVERALATDSTTEWVQRLEKVAIACGPIYELDEVFQDPQVQHLELVTEVEQPGLGPVRMLGFPFRLSAGPIGVRRPAPRLGEHTDEVLEELGLEPTDIKRLLDAGVVED
jgi:crotonobetainyl-CoA:carnitine CoA-transferase CaiB-like acyl-CoA transferase